MISDRRPSGNCNTTPSAEGRACRPMSGFNTVVPIFKWAGRDWYSVNQRRTLSTASASFWRYSSDAVPGIVNASATSTAKAIHVTPICRPFKKHQALIGQQTVYRVAAATATCVAGLELVALKPHLAVDARAGRGRVRT
jgi:hypothetical protein